MLTRSLSTVFFFYNEQGKGGEHYRKKNKLRCAVANGKKRPCEVNIEDLVSLFRFISIVMQRMR